MAKTPKPEAKNSSVLLSGTLSGPIAFEIRLSDPEYVAEAFVDDIKFERVWFLDSVDKQGWMKLVYSADGPTGNPWQIGKIRFAFSLDTLDKRFKDLSNIRIEPAKE